MISPPAGYHLRHHRGRNRSQQDTVAEMPGGNEVALNCRRTQDGQTVRGAGTQPSPGFEDAASSQSRDHGNGGSIELLDRIAIGALVVSGLFHAGPDQNSPIAAGHQVALAPDYMAQG